MTGDTDIAILHDQLTVHGGAEHVAFELARTFDAPIYAAAVEDDVVPDDIECIEIAGSFGRRCMASHYLVEDIYQMLRWQHVEELYEFDVLITNKNNPGWFVPQPDQAIVNYCHSTPRGPYDQFHKRGEGYLSRLVKTPIRVLYWPNRAYPDVWAANSDLVARRLQRYWDKEQNVDVIYPPVSTSQYSAKIASTRDYYFTVSRLASNKGLGELVEAFNGLDQRLVIAGDGSERDRLEELAGENVELVGYVSESEKARRLAEAKALLFNADDEDFGMVPVEAMAAGTPVIGVREGFTQHQILNQKNGILFDRGIGNLRAAVRRFDRDGVDWSETAIEQFATQFSADRFRRQMRQLVDRAQEKADVDPDWDETSVPESPTVEGAITDGGGQ